MTSEEGGYRALPKTPGILVVSSIPFLTRILVFLFSPICSDLRGGWLPSSTKDTWYFGRKFNTISNPYFKCSCSPQSAVTSEEGGYRALPKTPGILVVSSIPFLTRILVFLFSPICSDLRGGWLPSSTKDTWYFGRKFNTISNPYFKCSCSPQSAVTSEEGGYRALPKTPGILVVSSIPFLTRILVFLFSPICSDLRGGWLPSSTKTPGILVVSSIPFLTRILVFLFSPICSDLRGEWLPSSTKTPGILVVSSIPFLTCILSVLVLPNLQ